MAEFEIKLSEQDLAEAGFAFNDLILGKGSKWETSRFHLASAAMMMGAANNLMLHQANALGRADTPIPELFTFAPKVGIATQAPPAGIKGHARVAWLANNRAIRLMFRHARSVYHSRGLIELPSIPPEEEPAILIAEPVTIGTGIAIAVGIVGAAAVGGYSWYQVEAKRASVELDKHTRAIAAHAAEYSKYLTATTAAGQKPEPPDDIVSGLAKDEENSNLALGITSGLVGVAIGAAAMFAGTKPTRRSNPSRRRKKKATAKRKTSTKRRASSKKKTTRKKSNPSKRPNTKAAYIRSAMARGRTKAEAEGDWKRKNKRKRKNPSKKKTTAKRRTSSKKKTTRKRSATKRKTNPARRKKKATAKRRASSKKKTARKKSNPSKATFIRSQRRKGRSAAQAASDWKARQRIKKMGKRARRR